MASAKTNSWRYKPIKVMYYSQLMDTNHINKRGVTIERLWNNMPFAESLAVG
jgi:hypothetical protein